MAEATHFDYLVIGGGSGGVSSARRAASYGAKVAVIEKARWGGTCVNVGCVPKKVMFCAASTIEAIHSAKQFGISVDTGSMSIDWAKLKEMRDAYVLRLNGIYERNMGKSDVTMFEGEGKFTGPKEVTVNGTKLTADHITIAVGGAPRYPTIPGAEHCITSDEFFELEEQPKRVTVVGGGYIAVELAGIFAAMGSKVQMFVRRKNGLLSAFDPYISENLAIEYERNGIDLQLGRQPDAVEKNADGSFTVKVGEEEIISDCVLYAIGRTTVVDALDPAATGLEVTPRGIIPVDEYSNTNVAGVYALGDVIGKADLTPVAIRLGRRLADRLFGGFSGPGISFDTIPTVVFSHPTIGTVGLTEPKAVEKYGEDNITIYRSRFTNLYYGPWEMPSDDKPKTSMKVICEKSTEKVLGIHILGMAADEIMQGFGVAMVMGATKADLDACTAIHPTAGEELVTLGPWGMSWKNKDSGAGAGAAL